MPGIHFFSARRRTFRCVLLFGLSILLPPAPALVAERNDWKEGDSASTSMKFDFLHNTSLVVIPIFVNDHGPYRFLLDTGASNSILSSDIAGLLKLGGGRKEKLATAGGPVAVTIHTLDVLQMGKIRIQRAPIAVADLRLLGNLRVDGVLGGDYLRRFTVSIDYLKRFVRIEPRF